MNMTELQMLFFNLINNAIDACKKQNKLSETDYTGRIMVSVRFEENFYVIEVTDNGCGIPNNIRQRIYDLKVTSKSTSQSMSEDSIGKEGSGIGLFYIKQMLMPYGGNIREESYLHDEPNVVTRFTVNIPYQYASRN
jgi:sensor histidine kinase regulating citrate/malate metabolism